MSGIASGAAPDFLTLVRLQNGTIRLPFPVSVNGNPHDRGSDFGVTITEKNSFGLRATYVSQNTTNIVAGWQGILRKII